MNDISGPTQGQRRIVLDLPDDLVDQLLGLDCGDNSCQFRDRAQPGGMRTNGGCRCLKSLPLQERVPVLRLVDRVVRELRT